MEIHLYYSGHDNNADSSGWPERVLWPASGFERNFKRGVLQKGRRPIGQAVKQQWSTEYTELLLGYTNVAFMFCV